MTKRVDSDNGKLDPSTTQKTEQQQEESQANVTPINGPSAEDFEKEIEALKNTVLRLMADNENIRKRFTKELEESNSYAIHGFAKDVVEILENLNRAIDNVPSQEMEDASALKSFADGVIMTKKILEDVFNKYGITRLHPLLDKFDHNYHQAIGQAPDATQPPNTVLQVIQAGYRIKDRLLKPALVIVSTNQE